MKCNKCPMYHYWSNESDRGEECSIFGYGWASFVKKCSKVVVI